MAKCGRFGSIEAIGVIDLALFRIGEVFIGFCDFSKLLYCLVAVIGVLIGVPLYRELLVGSLDVCFGG